MARHDAYALLLQGTNVLDFINGLSTNLVTGLVHNRLHQSSRSDHRCVRGGSGRLKRCAYWVSSSQGRAALAPQRTHPRTADQHQRHQRTERCVHWNRGFSPTRRDDGPPELLWHHVHRAHTGEVGRNMVSERVEGTSYSQRNSVLRSRNQHHGSPAGCALGDLVHPQKGCYVGQEVLVRMRSRGKLGHRLVRRINPVTKATTVGRNESLVLERIQ